VSPAQRPRLRASEGGPTVRTFVDTNVLVYADDRAAGAKQKTAQVLIRRLVAANLAVLSTQVLQEYFVAATNKLRLPAEAAGRQVQRLASLPVIQIDADLILAAIDLHRLRPISFWDALIIRSAVAGRCGLVLTGDLAHGEMYDGLRVENPFRGLG
jgi:predicted nucleic acid-binding protein